MPDFRALSETMLASPQVNVADITEAKAAGVTLVVNNRPDGEDPDAPQGDEIEAAAHAVGLAYVAIPIGQGSFSHTQTDALIEAMAATQGKVLGYCRSGTRSTFLWALAQARTGAMQPEDIASAAMAAGYDVTPIRPMIDMLAGDASGAEA